MKVMIRLLLVALILHATWRAAAVYLRYYAFKDDVTHVAQFATNQTDSELRSRVIDAAKRRDVALDPANVTVKRQPHHIIIDAAYTEQVELAPRYFYPWDAKVHVEVLTLVLQEAR